MSVVYHLTDRESWARAQAAGEVRAPSLETEGFIHCSTGSQHAATATRHYRGRSDLVLLFVDAERLGASLRLERARDIGEDFPHVYGPIPLDAVFEATEYPPSADGTFEPHDEAGGFDVVGGARPDEIEARATAAMAGYDRPWAIAGGWALDLFVGTRTRPHADLELTVRRADLPALFEHLEGWDRRVVVGYGTLQRWSGGPVPEEHHQIWVRRGDHPARDWREFVADDSMLDLLVEPHEQDTWICRREPSIRLPQDETISRTPAGTPYVRPEIALLFKAKHRRYKDERDLARALPLLGDAARAWLRDAIARAHGASHPWISRADPAR